MVSSIFFPAFLLILPSLLCTVLASPAQQPFQTNYELEPEDGNEGPPGWFDPRGGGGQMIDFTTRTRGEPLNVIISGASDPFILTDDGFDAYARSIGYAKECMGLHMGNIHLANLGDGDGRKPEALLFRQHYRLPRWGTCWESLAGGHHFRAWRQNGTEGNSGAWFLGVSKEEDSSRRHTIVANGYNLGRDWLVEQALIGTELWLPYGVLSAEAEAALRSHPPRTPGRTSPTPKGWSWPRWGGWPWPGTGGDRLQWRAEVEWRGGLLEPGRKGINHNIAQDGRVAILTVSRVPTDLD